VVALVVLSISSIAAGQVFSEDFESYAPGSEMHGQGGWKGWDNLPSAGAPTSGVYFHSGAISVEIGGATDLVHEFDITGGRWEMKVMQYIPSGTTGENWFILLNTYNDAGVNGGAKDWSAQATFNLAAGTIAYWHGGAATIVYDEWVELKYVIDLDNNTVDKYYNGEFIVTDQWDDNDHGTLQCVDLFGNGASPIYYDDITIEEYVVYTAHNPDPADGAVGVVNALLRWTSGDTSVLHDVYLGTSAELTEADLVGPHQLFTMYFHMAGLEPGTTYYWRVDEVEADSVTLHEGDVWSFTTTPLTAHTPDPGDGYKWALPDVTLTWQPGRGASLHELYFGADADAVAGRDASVSIGELNLPSYEAGTLEQGATCYWAVDEIDAGGAKHEGEVWSFRIMPEIAVTNPDLLGWWTLKEGAGATTVDWSGHGNHGSLRGDPEWIDGALTFDGRDDYVSVLLDVSETEYAAALWFKATNANCGLMAVVDSDLGSSHDRHVYLTGGNIKIRLWDTEEIETVGLNLANGQWHHVVYTYGAAVGGQKLYVDGVLRASGTKDASDFDWQERINIGFSHDAAQDYFEGVLEDVRIYGKTLSEEEVQQVMRGNPLLAWSPQPPRDATVDIRDATALRWSAGDTAVSHDVYFGLDWDAVANAGADAGEYQASQPGTSFSAAGLVAFGGGDYYWRIDEVEAGGTVHTGYVWKFTVPDYLIVDDFERYTNEVGERAFEAWIDGVGFTLPEPGNPGNGTGAAVGHDVWDTGSPYYNGSIMETRLVVDGAQSLPLYYDNSASPYRSEAQRTWAVPQDWTSNGVDTLVLYMRGIPTNAAEPVYVVIEDNLGQTAVVTQANPNAALATQWIEWEIALSDLTDAGVNPAAVKKMTIGLGNQAAPTPGGSGVLYVDEVRVVKPAL